MDKTYWRRKEVHDMQFWPIVVNSAEICYVLGVCAIVVYKGATNLE